MCELPREACDLVLMRMEQAVLKRDTKALQLAAGEMEQLLKGYDAKDATKAAVVLGIMGRVGDADNAPKVFQYLKRALIAFETGESIGG